MKLCKPDLYNICNGQKIAIQKLYDKKVTIENIICTPNTIEDAKNILLPLENREKLLYQANEIYKSNTSKIVYKSDTLNICDTTKNNLIIYSIINPIINNTKVSCINNICCVEIDRTKQFTLILTSTEQLFFYDKFLNTLIQVLKSPRRITSAIFTVDNRYIILGNCIGDLYAIHFNSLFTNKSDDIEFKYLCSVSSCVLHLSIVSTSVGIFLCIADKEGNIRISKYPDIFVIHGICLGHGSPIQTVEPLESKYLQSLSACHPALSITEFDLNPGKSYSCKLIIYDCELNTNIHEQYIVYNTYKDIYISKDKPSVSYGEKCLICITSIFLQMHSIMLFSLVWLSDSTIWRDEQIVSPIIAIDTKVYTIVPLKITTCNDEYLNKQHYIINIQKLSDDMLILQRDDNLFLISKIIIDGTTIHLDIMDNVKNNSQSIHPCDIYSNPIIESCKQLMSSYKKYQRIGLVKEGNDDDDISS